MVDDAWRTRIPPGWVQLQDGSFGPPPDPGVGPAGGVQIPPSLTGGSPAADPLGSSVTVNQPPGTTLNNTGPDVIPPQNSTIPPNKSVGPFTGGSATDNWFKADPNATFQEGQPMNGPGGPAAGGSGFNPLSLFGGGNPYWRGAIAGGGVLSPTPAETGEMPRQTLGRRPSGPNNLFPPTPSGIGSDANFPVSGASGFPGTYAAPGQQPPQLGGAPAAVAGGGGRKGRINPGSVNLGAGIPNAARAQVPPAASSPFIGIDRQNAGANERNRGSPQGTALNLSALFSHPAVAAAAAAHPNVQAHVAARVAGPLSASQLAANPPMPPRVPADIAELRHPNPPGVTIPNTFAGKPHMTTPYNYVNT